VAIILPDGVTTLFLTNIDTLSYIVSTIARGPYPVTAGQALAYQWHGLEPNGVYHLVAALARPGSLADGKIDEGDILALEKPGSVSSKLRAYFQSIRPRTASAA
jgi:hypothetical protein